MKQVVLFLMLALCWVGSANAADYDVYILAGQSNMDGRGNVSDLTGTLASPQAGQLIYYVNPGDGDTTVRSSGWDTLAPGYSVSPGTSRSSALPNGTFGPEVSFVDALSTANPTGKPIAIIKISRGGTSLHTDWSPTGFMYNALISEVDQALLSLSGSGHTGEIKGMLWHQGESDAAYENTYQDNLETLIANVRDEFETSAMPFYIGELAPTKPESFRNMQKTIADDNANVFFVSSAGLDTKSDGTHFNSASQVILGQRFAEAVLVPEPGSMAALCVGGLMLLQRRSRRQHALFN